MNQAIFVGRIVAEPTINTTESGASVCNITIAIPRPYKNEEGVYETDFIDCTLWNSVAQRTSEYCKKGDLVGVKGRVQTEIIREEGLKKKVNIIAEKITFMSSRQKVQEKSNEDVEQDIEK